jgi:hypothetical protein
MPVPALVLHAVRVIGLRVRRRLVGAEPVIVVVDAIRPGRLRG